MEGNTWFPKDCWTIGRIFHRHSLCPEMCQGSEGLDEDVWSSRVRNYGTWQNMLEKEGYETPGARKERRDHHIHVHEQLGKTKLVWSCSTQDFTGKHHSIFPNPCAFPWAFARALAKQTFWIRGAFSLTQDKVIPIKCKNQESFWYKTKQTLPHPSHSKPSGKVQA